MIVTMSKTGKFIDRYIAETRGWVPRLHPADEMRPGVIIKKTNKGLFFPRSTNWRES